MGHRGAVCGVGSRQLPVLSAPKREGAFKWWQCWPVIPVAPDLVCSPAFAVRTHFCPPGSGAVGLDPVGEVVAPPGSWPPSASRLVCLSEGLCLAAVWRPLESLPSASQVRASQKAL